MNKFYKNTIEHIHDEMIYADLSLHLEVLHHKETIRVFNTSDIFNGLYLTAEKIEKINNGTLTQRDWDVLNYEKMNNLEIAIKTHRKQINQKIENSYKQGKEVGLVKLSQLFKLDEIELRLVSICLVVQINPNYTRLINALTGNDSTSIPTIDLLNSIIYHTPDKTNIPYKNYLSANSSLLKNGILEVVNNNITASDPHGTDQVRIPEKIIDFIFEKDTISHELATFTMLHSPAEINIQLVPEEIKSQLSNILKQKKTELNAAAGSILFYFHGTRGTGKETTAKWLCAQMNRPLITVDLEQALNSGMPSFAKIMLLLRRESLLTGAVLYYRGMEHLFDGQGLVENKLQFIQAIQNHAGLQIFSSRESLELVRNFSTKDIFIFSFIVPGFKRRRELWLNLTSDSHKLDKDIDLDALANKFQLSGGQIRQALKQAYNLSLLRTNKNNNITIEDLTAACRSQSNHKLAELAAKIEPRHTWDDIILPKKQKQQLREIVDRANQKHIVFDEWGHGKKHSLGKGLSALFAGPSGTGKTMAAEIMAGELQLDLYKIDLSTIVSKYIGETEKNLSKIFKEAETSNAILFFDEADALFGARSEVKDAHDRYANIEVGYLLQKMDEYQGLAILATNLKNNMDKAFLRRIQFLVHFSDPDEQQRMAIWQNIFTSTTPLADDIDYAFLARQFKLTGGNIKNIGLGASFIAASNGKLVTMEHVIHATGREWNKIGRACTKQEFADFYDIVK